VNEPFSERVMALAGLFQACILVQQIAREGQCATSAFAASIASVLRTGASSAAAVYGGEPGVAAGLEVLCHQLAPGPGGRDPELTRYVVSLLFLERKLMRSPSRREHLRAGIERIRATTENVEDVDETTVGALAGLYSDTLSNLRPRIIVQGEARFLEPPAGASRVRALLLAGVRAAVLWRQLGGSRIGLLLQRTAYVGEARRLLGEG